MKTPDILSARLLGQRITGAPLDEAADVVRWMGAVQAQDYAGAKWAVALRTRLCTDAEMDAAFDAGEILRTHVMRPTWHFVPPEDIRWMQMLTGPRVDAILAYQYRRLELDAQVLKRSRAAMEKALLGGRQLTRAELGSALARAGIEADGLRLVHIVMRAELEAVLCSGGRRGKQFTYALVDERAPRQRNLDREAALALLTERYFISHGPATLQDYAWWSGLHSADVRAGVDMVKTKLIRDEVEGRVYWMSASLPEVRRPRGRVHLLPNYDEYIVGYTDRSAIFDSVHAEHLDARHNPLFNHTLVSSGRIVGTWMRSLARDSLTVSAKPFESMASAEAKGFRQAAKRFAKFSGAKSLDLSIVL